MRQLALFWDQLSLYYRYTFQYFGVKLKMRKSKKKLLEIYKETILSRQAYSLDANSEEKLLEAVNNEIKLTDQMEAHRKELEKQRELARQRYLKKKESKK